MTIREQLLAVLLLTAAVYLPIRSNAYVYEDHRVVSESMALSSSVLNDPRQWSTLGRDLTMYSVWIPAKIAGSDAAPIQHAVGVAVHLLNGLLLFAVLSAVVTDKRAALLGTAVYLLHPIMFETVGYVASRADLLMQTGMLAALWCVTRNRVRWFALSLALLFALASKQTAVVLLPMIWLVPIADKNDQWKARSVTLALAAIIAVAAYHFVVIGQPDSLPYPPLARAAYQATAFWRMVSLVIMPYGFSIDHDIGQAPLWVAGLSLWAICFTVYLSAIQYRAGRPWIGFCLGAPLLVILPRLILPWPEFFNEHQASAFMPCVAMLVAMGYQARASVVMWFESLIQRAAGRVLQKESVA